MTRPRLLALFAAPVVLATAVAAVPPATDDFAAAAVLIKPRPGEHAWAQIPWHISVAEGQKKAAATGKPLLLARAAQGCVVGCL